MEITGTVVRGTGLKLALPFCLLLRNEDIYYFQHCPGGRCHKCVCLNSWPEVGSEILDGKSRYFFHVQTKSRLRDLVEGIKTQPLNCFIFCCRLLHIHTHMRAHTHIPPLHSPAQLIFTWPPTVVFWRGLLLAR